MFKAFLQAAVAMFVDEEHWYKQRYDKDWDVIMPVLQSYNGLRKKLFITVMLILDESMSGLRPKTTAYGGLPSITFEPHKPVQLGTEFKNGIECLGGSMAYQDIVMAPELQNAKKFFFVNNFDVNDSSTHQLQKTSLPGNPNIQAHTTEVL
jgi:hypothetical protein